MTLTSQSHMTSSFTWLNARSA